MEEFDFIKGFAGVDLLSVDAVGKVIGRAIASLFQGMVEAGLDEGVALVIINNAVGAFFENFLKNMNNLSKEDEEEEEK
jgi:hypothetical protein